MSSSLEQLSTERWLVILSNGEGLDVATYSTYHSGFDEQRAAHAADQATRENPKKHILLVRVVSDLWTEVKAHTSVINYKQRP